jgi:hypothetical protein
MLLSSSYAERVVGALNSESGACFVSFRQACVS